MFFKFFEFKKWDGRRWVYAGLAELAGGGDDTVLSHDGVPDVVLSAAIVRLYHERVAFGEVEYDSIHYRWVDRKARDDFGHKSPPSDPVVIKPVGTLPSNPD